MTRMEQRAYELGSRAARKHMDADGLREENYEEAARRARKGAYFLAKKQHQLRGRIMHLNSSK